MMIQKGEVIILDVDQRMTKLQVPGSVIIWNLQKNF